MLQRWAKQYTAYGEDAFEHSTKNTSYTKEFKEKVVLEYLNGNQSNDDLTIKYNIRSFSTIKKWVNDYNGHIELKNYIPKGEDLRLFYINEIINLYTIINNYCFCNT